MTIDHEQIIISDILARFGALHLTVKAALDRVILQQISEVIGGHEVVQRDHLELLAEKSLVMKSAEDEPADAPEAVDTDLNHSACFKVGYLEKTTLLEVSMAR